MSDGYSNWCEEQEKRLHKFSHKNFEKIKATKLYTDTLQDTKKLLSTAIIKECKNCATCKHCITAHGVDNYNLSVCSKLGLSCLNKNWVCNHWKEKHTQTNINVDCLFVNPNVIAFNLLNTHD